MAFSRKDAPPWLTRRPKKRFFQSLSADYVVFLYQLILYNIVLRKSMAKSSDHPGRDRWTGFHSRITEIEKEPDARAPGTVNGLGQRPISIRGGVPWRQVKCGEGPGKRPTMFHRCVGHGRFPGPSPWPEKLLRGPRSSIVCASCLLRGRPCAGRSPPGSASRK